MGPAVQGATCMEQRNQAAEFLRGQGGDVTSTI
jgi:hypothetical protein